MTDATTFSPPNEKRQTPLSNKNGFWIFSELDFLTSRLSSKLQTFQGLDKFSEIKQNKESKQTSKI